MMAKIHCRRGLCRSPVACGAFGQKCEAMDGLDIESAISAVEEAEGLQVPLGFGRD